jgi:hypothetical protein
MDIEDVAVVKDRIDDPENANALSPFNDCFNITSVFKS